MQYFANLQTILECYINTLGCFIKKSTFVTNQKRIKTTLVVYSLPISLVQWLLLHYKEISVLVAITV